MASAATKKAKSARKQSNQKSNERSHDPQSQLRASLGAAKSTPKSAEKIGKTKVTPAVKAAVHRGAESRCEFDGRAIEVGDIVSKKLIISTKEGAEPVVVSGPVVKAQKVQVMIRLPEDVSARYKRAQSLQVKQGDILKVEPSGTNSAAAWSSPSHPTVPATDPCPVRTI
jgi:hypothetical protein